MYGPYGRRSYRSRATKVLVLGEPISLPIRRAYDYALSWHLREDRYHLRVPLGTWNLLQHPDSVVALESRSFAEWRERPYFCNFIYSNPRALDRRNFFKTLSRLRFVHSPGEVETNTEPIPGGRAAADWWSRKLSYQRQFRFTIAFENATLPGYTSEKLIDGLLAGTLPIYAGNPDIARDVRSGSFIDARAFHSWEELADYVVRLDDNRELARPYFEGSQPLLIDFRERRSAILALFSEASSQPRTARRVERFGRPWLIQLDRVRRLPARIGDRTPWNRGQARKPPDPPRVMSRRLSIKRDRPPARSPTRRSTLTARRKRSRSAR